MTRMTGPEPWLPDVEVIDNARAGGGTYATGVPWRFVGHTTEAVPRNVDGARAMAGRHEFPPHLWCWPEKQWVAGTVRLDRSAFALKQPAGKPPTNKARALQAEIIGFAGEAHLWPDDWWLWLGQAVVAPLIAAGYPLNLGHLAPTTGTDGYGLDGAVRMTWDEWAAFDGLSIHASVPGNLHWDLGAGRLDLIAQGAGHAHPILPSPTPPELDMPLTVRLLRAADSAAVHVMASDLTGRPRWVPDEDALADFHTLWAEAGVAVVGGGVRVVEPDVIAALYIGEDGRPTIDPDDDLTAEKIGQAVVDALRSRLAGAG